MPTSKSEYQSYTQSLAERRKESKHSRETDSYHATMSGKEKDALVSRSHRSFWRLFQAFWGLLRGFHLQIVIGLVTLTISTGLALIPPVGTKIAIDSALTSPPAPLPDWLTTWLTRRSSGWI